MVLATFGVYVGWNLTDREGVLGLPWLLLLIVSLVLPPWGTCRLVGLAVSRRGGMLVRVGWLFDAAGWLAGTVVSAVAFSLSYDEAGPDPWTVLLFLAYSVPAYVVAALVRVIVGPRRYAHVARLLAAAVLTGALTTLAFRVVTILGTAD